MFVGRGRIMDFHVKSFTPGKREIEIDRGRDRGREGMMLIESR